MPWRRSTEEERIFVRKFTFYTGFLLILIGLFIYFIITKKFDVYTLPLIVAGIFLIVLSAFRGFPSHQYENEATIEFSKRAQEWSEKKNREYDELKKKRAGELAQRPPKDGGPFVRAVRMIFVFIFAYIFMILFVSTVIIIGRLVEGFLHYISTGSFDRQPPLFFDKVFLNSRRMIIGLLKPKGLNATDAAHYGFFLFSTLAAIFWASMVSVRRWWLGHKPQKSFLRGTMDFMLDYRRTLRDLIFLVFPLFLANWYALGIWFAPNNFISVPPPEGFRRGVLIFIFCTMALFSFCAQTIYESRINKKYKVNPILLSINSLSFMEGMIFAPGIIFLKVNGEPSRLVFIVATSFVAIFLINRTFFLKPALEASGHPIDNRHRKKGVIIVTGEPDKGRKGETLRVEVPKRYDIQKIKNDLIAYSADLNSPAAKLYLTSILSRFKHRQQRKNIHELIENLNLGTQYLKSLREMATAEMDLEELDIDKEIRMAEKDLQLVKIQAEKIIILKEKEEKLSPPPPEEKTPQKTPGEEEKEGWAEHIERYKASLEGQRQSKLAIGEWKKTADLEAYQKHYRGEITREELERELQVNREIYDRELMKHDQ